MQEPVQPLSILRARPIGMMHMVDEGENDFSSPDEAVGAVQHAMELYEKHFAPTS